MYSRTSDEQSALDTARAKDAATAFRNQSRRGNFGLGTMHREPTGEIHSAIDKVGGDLKKDWVYEGQGLDDRDAFDGPDRFDHGR